MRSFTGRGKTVLWKSYHWHCTVDSLSPWIKNTLLTTQASLNFPGLLEFYHPSTVVYYCEQNKNKNTLGSRLCTKEVLYRTSETTFLFLHYTCTYMDQHGLRYELQVRKSFQNYPKLLATTLHAVLIKIIEAIKWPNCCSTSPQIIGCHGN